MFPNSSQLPEGQRTPAPPPCGAALEVTAPVGLEVDELQMASDKFDPSEPSLHSQITSKLGCSQNSTIEALQGFRGGLNDGVWILCDAAQSPKEDMVLKLVKCHSIASTVPTEAENLVKISREHPAVSTDRSIAFPFKIFTCFGSNGEKRHDLIVMRKVPGRRLTDVIAVMWHKKQVQEVMQLFEKLGMLLAKFHATYDNIQHGDFQPSNVVYDKEQDQMLLIDVGGMGMPTFETDIERFNMALRLLSGAYGADFGTDGTRHFEAGYANGRN